MRIATFLLSLGLTLTAVVAQAHEFWISPESYQVAPGDDIRGRLEVGQQFSGSSLLFNPDHFVRFEAIDPEGTRAVSGRLGDDPALVVPARGDGLLIAVHETTDRVLTYPDLDHFRVFVDQKDFRGAIDRHLARGLPDAGFVETYRRYAKALIAVGSGAGKDQRVGLKIEIVAEANPYTDDLSAGMPLRVWLDGEPRADAQVELFERDADGTVTLQKLRTDAEGHVIAPVRPGADYMADSVVLLDMDLPKDAEAKAPAYHTDWASLTFHVPAQ
ncbi:DUF4198 domain-containing protein [Tropicimonas sp. IMCC34043]|uniref:DUF4198 domain-containing protein n=1 Tax=Tropicimonas sp. IMCC34043 TaxID=2248760 RepID=UPI000E26A6E4|nr:DUF4198 domain-containing protein [Tropicimonas sp. IMCC34043]